jgi:ankyrin repeat protein
MVMQKSNRHGSSSLHRKDVKEIVTLLKKDCQNNEEVNRAFQKAIKNKDLQLIRILLSNGVKIEPFNDNNQTAIHFAVENDCLNIVDLLFSHCNNNINYTDKSGLTHCHVACITGNVKVVQDFIENGIDMNFRFDSNTHDDRNNFTLLHFAVKYGKLEIVTLLLSLGADTNAIDFFDRTPLHLICSISEIIGDFILPKKINIFQKYNDNCRKAISYQNTTLEILKLLIEYNSNVNAKDKNGDTPLAYIFQDNTTRYIEKKFLRNSLDFRIFNKVFSQIKRIIIKQLRKKQKQKLKYLLEHNANVKMRNRNGDSVLHLAIESLKLFREINELAEPYFDDSIIVDMVKLLLKYGVNVNATNKMNETPVHIAVRVLSAEIVDVLIKYNADINSIKLVYDDNCFYYPNILPCLEATENLLSIISTLSSKNFQFNQTDNLVLLRFFICNNIDCRYGDPEDENASYKLENLLELGTNVNIQNTLNNISRESRYLKGMISDQINRYIIKLKNGNLYINKETEDYLRSKILPDSFEVSKQDLEEYENEANKMKTVVFNNKKSISDILSMHPEKSYSCFKNSNYKEILLSKDFHKTYYHNNGIIKGYFTKSLIRKFVLKLSNDNLRILIGITLPDLCCEKISSYLSNDDLWNLCLSTTIEIMK